MKYETIIIGGGLSGLLSGISLAERGHKVAIISAGQSALHFSSGSFELFDSAENPLQGIASLSEEHPYRKIGLEAVEYYADAVKEIFARAGVKCSGDKSRNHYRITPIGMIKSAWLTLDDYATFDSAEELPWRRVALVNFEGYIDFYPKFLESCFAKRGVDCETFTLTLKEFEHLRESATEMRATNIARVMTGDILSKIAQELKGRIGDAEALFMPAVFGMFDDEAVTTLRSMVRVPLYFIPTMPASVPGVRTQIQLKNYFQKLGGVYLLGDNVTEGVMEGGRLKSILTANHGDMEFEADNFVLATGSFFSHGIIASQEHIYEPIFGLDVAADAHRSEWYNQDLYAHQPYMGYGVTTDEQLRCKIGGESVANLYAVGSVLASQNAIVEGTGGGVAITTALYVADKIINA